MRRLIFLVLVAVACVGCQTYNERFTYVDPSSGSTNHVVHVSYRSCLLWGKAARLKTETQTMEFIRTVNADGLETRPDAASVKAISDGIMSALLRYAGGQILPARPIE